MLNNNNLNVLNNNIIKNLIMKFLIVLLFLLILIIVPLQFYVLYLIYKSLRKNSIILSNNISNINDISKENIRNLDENNNIENNLNISKENLENILEDYYNIEYIFLNNITRNKYYGKWSEFLYKNFNNKNGKSEFLFYKRKLSSNNLIINFNREYENYKLFKNKTNKNKYSNISIGCIIQLSDGNYKDRIIRGNFSFFFPINFIDIFKNKKENISITNFNSSISLYEIEYYSISNSLKYLNNTNITLTFENIDKNKENVISSIKIKNDNISIFISGQRNKIIYRNKLSSISIYSYVLVILSITEIILISKLYIEVINNIQIGLNLDITTILISIIYKSYVSTLNFFFSIDSDDIEISYYFGIVSILYFICYTALELRLLIMVYRARYYDLIVYNQNLFRKKICMFYLIFYGSILFSYVYIREILIEYNIFLFISFWLFQIIYSTVYRLKPSYSKKYILISSINKIFIAVYLKGNKYNFLELKPNYFKITIIVIIVLIECIILILQKNVCTQILIPKKYRKTSFNYYRNHVDISKHISQNKDCVICLDSLIDDNNNENDDSKNNNTIDNINYNKVHNNNNNNIFKKNKFLKKIYSKIKNFLDSLKNENVKKKYMITPCDHVFHTQCLEKWMELKNECPYCRQKIPSIE